MRATRLPPASVEHEAPRLSPHMFGTFRVMRDGHPITSQIGGKGRQLLKLLAAAPSWSLPKEILLERLWPHSDPIAASTSLKVAVHNLRAALEPRRRTGDPGTWIMVEDGLYRLIPDAPICIDVIEFVGHWQAERRAEAAGDRELAQREYQDAADLYTGDYLEDDLYEDWPTIRREELRDIYLQIVNKLANMYMADRDYESALTYAHKIVAADPCREDAYCLLLRAHAAMNNVARAGSWYAICRITLGRALGVDPSPATTQLFESLFDEPAESGISTLAS